MDVFKCFVMFQYYNNITWQYSLMAVRLLYLPLPSVLSPVQIINIILCVIHVKLYYGFIHSTPPRAADVSFPL